jgi:aminoglycoside phosphotransferase (APT) family kinase protein
VVERPNVWTREVRRGQTRAIPLPGRITTDWRYLCRTVSQLGVMGGSGDRNPKGTGLLLRWGQGDQDALEQLIPLVHHELRRIARCCMAGERVALPQAREHQDEIRDRRGTNPSHLITSANCRWRTTMYARAVRPPPAEVTIDTALVRALLEEQHPDLAGFPLVDAGEGWDNRTFQLGEDLAVRLPRRAASAPLIEHEQRWLSIIAPHLPLPVPYPIRIGRAGCGFPWQWSVTRWLAGETALVSPLPDEHAAAADLARFLRALHRPAPLDAPRNSWRGVPLEARSALLREHVAAIAGRVDHAAIIETWERLRATPPWTGSVWIHGDLHPGNVLVRAGRLSGVLDFGDLTAGDPATDLSVAWMLLQEPARSTFRDLTCGAGGWLDSDAWTRARAWALALGAAHLAHAGSNNRFAAVAAATIDEALMA